jgi:hypothetical protein
MFHRWAALVLVLALCAMSPKNAAGQAQSMPRGHSAGGLGNNYPNPFNPDTYIPFTVGDQSCAGVGETHVVTVRIVNIFGQVAVFPILSGPSTTSTTSGTSALNGRPLKDLTLACGDYVAYWNGKTPRGQEAASGVYMVQIFIDGKLLPDTKKMFYAK